MLDIYTKIAIQLTSVGLAHTRPNYSTPSAPPISSSTLIVCRKSVVQKLTTCTHIHKYILYSGVVKVPRTATVTPPMTADTV